MTGRDSPATSFDESLGYTAVARSHDLASQLSPWWQSGWVGSTLIQALRPEHFPLSENVGHACPLRRRYDKAGQTSQPSLVYTSARLAAAIGRISWRVEKYVFCLPLRSGPAGDRLFSIMYCLVGGRVSRTSAQLDANNRRCRSLCLDGKDMETGWHIFVLPRLLSGPQIYQLHRFVCMYGHKFVYGFRWPRRKRTELFILTKEGSFVVRYSWVLWNANFPTSQFQAAENTGQQRWSD